MIQTKQIQIFKFLQDFNTPVEVNETISQHIGDLVIVIDNVVFVKDKNKNNDSTQFVSAVYSGEFVKMNDLIFKEVTELN